MESLAARISPAIAAAADAGEAIRIAVRAIHESSDRHDWTGVYLMEGDRDLVLADFIGAPSPHTRIDVGAGICGAAVRERATIVVDDVNADPRYLSCSLETKSEIVVPIIKDGIVYGEIDIDSHSPAAFTDADRREIEAVAAILADRIASDGGAR